MRTVELKVYQFNELSAEAKQNAINKLRDINVSDFNWWESTYEDANTIGLKITGFDLDRNRHATGELINTAEDVAEAIIQNHGEDCGTRQKAQDFLDELASLKTELAGAQRGEEDLNAGDIQGKIEDLETDFKDILLEEYACILQNECDYLQSDEAIIETIEANEYEFTGDGKLYKGKTEQNEPEKTKATPEQIKNARELLRVNGYFVQNLWTNDDIISKGADMEIEISTEQALEIMDKMGREFNAELGVNWDTIEETILDYFSNKVN